jgi:hypothetical protein
VGILDHPCKRWFKRGPLRDIAAGPVPAVGPVNAEDADTAARVPPCGWLLAEQQERGIGNGKSVAPGDDETVSLQDLQNRPSNKRGTGQEFFRQTQVKVVNGGVGPDLLLIADPAVGLFSLVDDFLRLVDNLVSHPVGKTIAVNHYRFRGYGYLQDNDWLAIKVNPLNVYSNCRSQPPFRHCHEFGDNIVRVGMARGEAVIVNAQQEGPAIGIGECSYIFSNEVPDCSAVKDFLPAVLLIPEGLEFDELPLALADEALQFRCGKEFLHFFPSVSSSCTSLIGTLHGYYAQKKNQISRINSNLQMRLMNDRIYATRKEPIRPVSLFVQRIQVCRRLLDLIGQTDSYIKRFNHL